MNIRAVANRCMTFTLKALIVASLFGAAASSSLAGEPIRIWVDASGRYSVEAMLVRREGDAVILRRKDGGLARMTFDAISQRDQDYLGEYEQRMAELSVEPERILAEVPDYQPLPRLDLPKAALVASANAVLQMGVVTETTAYLDPPQSIQPDPSPDVPDLPEKVLRMDNVNTYDRCSELFSVGTTNDPMIGMSITVGFSLPGSRIVNRIVKFDMTSGSAKVIHQSDEAVTLLDHHPKSKRSLVLVGHSTSGQGGRLAMATGWRSDEFAINYHRALPGDESNERRFGVSLPHLRWARWIDEEHVVAIIDRTLVGWNLVSGEMYFRVDGIDASAVPALSGGRRYLAMPISGGVLVYETKEGKALGRIPAEPRMVPEVSFSLSGHALAITSQRRLLAWDLVNAQKIAKIDSKRSLGSDAAIWIDSDLVLTSSGILMSLQREAPVWSYHLSETKLLSTNGLVALFRKRPDALLAVVKMPHDGASEAIKWIDANDGIVAEDTWSLPGRSVWNASGWNDRDVRISAHGIKMLN
ncbi:MAG: SHD1 domain-containing protein [Pirellulaceae bacterium]